ASRATLTTGTPIINGGSLDGYRVQRGSVTVGGAGLDARQTDHTAILARAIEVNAGIWANALQLVTGVNDISADQTTVQARPADTGTAPAFALDVANLGGMYAGKITLVGTEAGLGVRNAGTIGASAGDVVIDAKGWLSNKGSLQASTHLSINVQGEVKNEKDIYAGGVLNIETRQALTNSGLIAAHGDLNVQAGSVNSTGSLAAGLNTDGSLKAAAARLDIQVEQQLTAQGNNLASGHVRLEGQALDIAGSQTRTQTLDLRASGRGTQAAPGTGLIDSRNADVLAYGNVSIDGNQLRTTDARLQALGDIGIAVTHVDNRTGLIRSGGGITVVANEIDNRDTRTAAGADPLGVIAQRVHLTTGDLLNQTGAIVAEENLTVVGTATGSGRIENAQGLLSAGATLDIHEATTATPATSRRLSITNTAGTLIADERLAVSARSLSLDGDVLSQQDMTLSLQGDHTHTAGSRTVANRDLTLGIENGGLHNSGALLAGRNLGFTATSLENTATGEISAGTTTDIAVTETLTNRGLIDGKNTRLRAQDLNNIGTGRIYGDVLVIQATALLNDTETVGGVRSDAVIAARERLDIGVQTLVNREGATIFSAGDMAIGGAL
ncbi:two-partner secretion domain-containing protein, partial [Hydrogenophaga sp.]|uniref:two-partner secretion domain-containing protein n=1 Tax=Hydrogenophaga sp. TaxID=1904254 RepID=UPI003FA5A6F4